jgi:hypothetical protein
LEVASLFANVPPYYAGIRLLAGVDIGRAAMAFPDLPTAHNSAGKGLHAVEDPAHAEKLFEQEL